MARANKAATSADGSAGTAGVPGVLVWCITGVQIAPALAESGVLGGAVRAAFGPVAAGLLWHLAMGLEIRVGKPGALSTGLPAVIARELRERLLSRLGLATRDRSAEQITRDRATATAVRLASRARLGPWGRHRLAAAVSRSRAAVHGDQRHQLMQELAARRNALGLRTVAVPAPWEAVPDELPQPTRRPEILAARELREMHPVDAIRVTASAHPDADPPELRALLGDLGIVVSETQVGIALKALAPARTRALASASAAGHKRRGIHARIEADAPPDAADADQPDADADRALLPDARRVDHDHRAEHGRAASLRALQAGLRIGQTRAQRIRALLDAEGPHS
ncbi:membrane protein [Streptomyces sp. SPB78]|nr:membrane protein [Streptomyces sp. SPB78]